MFYKDLNKTSSLIKKHYVLILIIIDFENLIFIIMFKIIQTTGSVHIFGQGFPDKMI